MNRAIVCVLVTLLFAGCASEPEKPGRDLQAASDFNAQLGVAYMRQGNNEWALNKLEKAVSQNPDNGRAHHYIAELYRRLGDYSKAEEHFQTAMRLLPDDLPLRENYGVYLCSRGEYAKGRKYLLEALDNPFNTAPAGTNENLGMCALEEGELSTAEQNLRVALRLEPKRPTALLGMAQIAYAKKDYMRARGFYQRYLDVAQQTAESLLTGIRIEDALGNQDNVASYSLLLRGKFPDSDEALELQRMEQGGTR